MFIKKKRKIMLRTLDDSICLQRKQINTEESIVGKSMTLFLLFFILSLLDGGGDYDIPIF